jgi:hypothetical protein
MSGSIDFLEINGDFTKSFFLSGLNQETSRKIVTAPEGFGARGGT